MTKITAFDKINDIEKKNMLNCFEATNIHYKKDTTILSNMLNTTVVGIIENGTWASSAARCIKETLEKMTNIEICEPVVTIKSTVKPETMEKMNELADSILAK